MEKRVLIAVFLSFLVLYVYQALFVKPVPKPAPPPAVVGAPQNPGAPSSSTPPPSASSASAPVPARVPSKPETVVADSAARQIVVETQVVRAVFSNRGAHLASWQVKGYLDDRGNPLDLVPSDLPDTHDRPFMMRTDDAAATTTLNTALFKLAQATGDRIDGTRTPVSLVFEYQDRTGLRARKEFRLEPSSYVIGFTTDVALGDQTVSPTVRWGPTPGDVTSEGSSFLQKPQGILFRNGSVERLPVEQQAVQEGTFRYAGVDDQYFLAAALAPDQPIRIEYSKVSVPSTSPTVTAARDFVDFSVRSSKVPQWRFFLGPKDFDILFGVQQELVQVINFGFFAFLAVPLLSALKWINAFAGNYGWSIVILTVLINAAMFPLRHKSVVSMRKLQQLQPEIKSIQDRYAKLKSTDPGKQKMNAEMMTLYKERGVNPASGCIPMLLTIPVLFAFYSLLSQAIEIRGAPFMFWIKDLSAHDPYFVTPILMGVTMVIQQKMTPSTADPIQQKMMMFMPIVFTAMFLWYPSGLALYWFVSNLLAIAQQYVTNKIIGPMAVRAIRPPAERQLKKIGGGATEAAAGVPAVEEKTASSRWVQLWRKISTPRS